MDEVIRKNKKEEKEPSALVALISWRDTDRPKKAVRVSSVEPTKSRP